MRRGRFVLVLAGVAVTATGLAQMALESPPPTPLLVTYGHENRPREGDPNFQQVLYISVPEAMRQPFLIRLFDPDTDGAHDLAFGRYGDSATRFAVFGGAGAYRPSTSREPAPDAGGPGRLLAEHVYGAEDEIDDTWQTLAELDPADGDPVDGRRYFRLLVDGVEGNEANVFAVAVGTPGDEDRAPPGARVVSFRPTVRVPRPGVVLELPLQLPAGQRHFTADSFDAYGAGMELALPLRSLPIETSGDNEWHAAEVELGAEDLGEPAAIVVGGGREWPNDITLSLTAGASEPVAMSLPPRLWPAKNVRPSVAATVTPQDCHGVILDAGSSSDADGGTLSYRWRFPDGDELTGERITRQYPEPGSYSVLLEVRDASPQIGRGASRDIEVEIKPPPVAKAAAASVVAPGEPVVLDGSASSVDGASLREYRWNVSDGAELTGETAQHVFAEPGRYTVTLTVEDDSGHPCNTASDEIGVTVNAAPVAVAGEDRRAAIGETLVFDARRSSDEDGRLTARRWDFGDGAAARGAVVEHAYSAAGSYQVRLAVTDDSRVANATSSDEITVVVNEPPVAALEPPAYQGGGLVRFDATASRDEDGAIARYRWDFGDGTRGRGATPTHVYAEPGTYEAVLTVADDSGTTRNTATRRARVVINAAPVADAGADVVVAPGEAVVLRGDRSVDPDGEIASYLWQLGDGTKAEGATAEHRFDTPGTYFARLTVADDSGDEEAIDFDRVRVVVNRSPHADAGPDVLAAPGKVVRLDAGGSFDRDGEIREYRWDFGDGTAPLTGRVIERTFDAPGVYEAQLTVRDDSGVANGTARDEATVRINHRPTAIAGKDVKTARRTVQFDGSASADADGDPLSFHWDFGDGTSARGARVAHTYARGGTFPVVLTVNDRTALANSRHRDTLTVRVDQPPQAVAGESQEVCTDDVVVLDGGGSRDPEGGALRYSWDFGDGTSSDIVNPTKVYEESGIYPVTLTVEDESGLPGNRHVDRIFVRVHQSPVADAGEDLRACANTPVQFDGSGSSDRDGVVNSYSWDFGDGASGGGDRPTHSYSRAGRYRAILTIEGDPVAQCDNTATDEVAVVVAAAPKPVIEAPATTPVAVPTTFDGSASTLDGGSIESWLWDFGDGSRAEGAVVEHSYQSPGVYRVELTVQGDAEHPDCRAVTRHRLITVNAAPQAVAGDDQAVGVGEPALFDAGASADSDGGITGYRWTFGDGAAARGMQVRHAYREPGRYEVTLTVEDDAGVANSSSSDTLQVEVVAAPRARIEAPAAACADQEIRLRAGGEAAGGASYAWLLGDGSRAEGSQVTHRFDEPGRYAVTLVLDDGRGFTTSRRSTSTVVRVNAPPHAVAGRDRIGCPGVAVSFTAAGSRDLDGRILRRVWDFGDGTTAKGFAVEHVYDAPGVYPVTLAVTDASGTACATTTVGLEVHIEQAPVAQAGPDREVWVGGANDALILDGSGSRAAAGRSLDYTWTLPGDVVLKGEKVKHVLSRAGAFDVTLRVDDMSGRACATASDTLHVVARQRRP